MPDSTQFPVCLTIAGSDSSGGAGIQADLRTFSSFSVYGTCVITAVTAQTPNDVISVQPVSQEVVASQLQAALDSYNVSAIKIGMVHSAETLKTLTPRLLSFPGPIVMDPVLAAGCGGVLNDSLPQEQLLDFIKSCVTVVTPNIPEAEYLLDTSISNRDETVAAAQELHRSCGSAVILKGGHARDDADRSLDIVATENATYLLTAPPLTPAGSHGTGCTLSSALASNLALGNDILNSAVAAKAFVWQSLDACVHLGKESMAMYPPESLDTSIVDVTRL